MSSFLLLNLFDQFLHFYLVHSLTFVFLERYWLCPLAEDFQVRTKTRDRQRVCDLLKRKKHLKLGFWVKKQS